jgi:Tfp pilus assembly PilM family ATPase
VRYGTRPLDGAPAEDAIAAVVPALGAVDKIVLHGPKAVPALVEMLNAKHALKVECLNPFASMAVPSTLPLADHFMRAPQRFAAAAGAALRAEE